MKHSTTTLCIASCLTAGLTFAQEGERKSPGGDGQNRMADFLKRIDGNADGKVTKEEFAEFSKKEGEDRFAKIDANGDGTADEAEVKTAMEKMRGGGDGNRGMRRPEGSPGGEGGFRRPPEGAPSPEGRRPEGGPPGAGAPGMGMMRAMGNPEEMFKRMDKNTDGTVDTAEYKEFATQEAEGRFKMMDSNSDGKIGAEEFKQVADRMRGMMMRGREGGAPGGPGGPRRPEGSPEGSGFRRPPSQDEGAPKPEGEKKPGGV